MLLFDIVCRDEGLSGAVLQYRVKIGAILDGGGGGLFTQGVRATYGQHPDYTNHWQLSKNNIFPALISNIARLQSTYYLRIQK